MGIIIYILLCGFPPFRADSGDQRELFQIILEGIVDFPSPFWDQVWVSVDNLFIYDVIFMEYDVIITKILLCTLESVDEVATDLILKILVPDPELRLTAEDILHHDWLNDPINKVSRSLAPAASMPSLNYFD